MQFKSFYEQIQRTKNENLLNERIYYINGIPYGTEPSEVGTSDPRTGEPVRERFKTATDRARTARMRGKIDPNFRQSPSYTRMTQTDDPNVLHARKRAKEQEKEFQQYMANMGYNQGGGGGNIVSARNSTPTQGTHYAPSTPTTANYNPYYRPRPVMGADDPRLRHFASTPALQQKIRYGYVPGASGYLQQEPGYFPQGFGEKPSTTNLSRVAGNANNRPSNYYATPRQTTPKQYPFSDKNYTANALDRSDNPNHKYWANIIRQMPDNEYQKVYRMPEKDRLKYFTQKYGNGPNRGLDVR